MCTALISPGGNWSFCADRQGVHHRANLQPGDLASPRWALTPGVCVATAIRD